MEPPVTPLTGTCSENASKHDLSAPNTARLLPVLPPFNSAPDVLCQTRRTSSLESLQLKYPTVASWLAQFEGRRIAWVGRGPHPAARAAELFESRVQVVIKQTMLRRVPYARFMEEVRLLEYVQDNKSGTSLQCPEFLGYFVDVDAEQGYIALEAVPGISLCYAARLAARIAAAPAAWPNVGDALAANWPLIIERVRRQLRALHGLGIVHNDVHEYNVLLEPATLQPWLLDYGQAQFACSSAEFAQDLLAARELLGMPQELAASVRPCCAPGVKIGGSIQPVSSRAG